MGHPHTNHMLPTAQLSESTVPYPVLWNFVHIGSSCSDVSTMIIRRGGGGYRMAAEKPEDSFH